MEFPSNPNFFLISHLQGVPKSGHEGVLSRKPFPVNGGKCPGRCVLQETESFTPNLKPTLFPTERVLSLPLVHSDSSSRSRLKEWSGHGDRAIEVEGSGQRGERVLVQGVGSVGGDFTVFRSFPSPVAKGGVLHRRDYESTRRNCGAEGRRGVVVPENVG